MRFLDLGMTRVSAVGCMVFLAATLGFAQDSSGPATTAAAGKSHASTKRSKSIRASARSTASKSKKSRKSAAARGPHGQQKIDAQRTLEIQEALIREHYLDGQASGTWNPATEQAMQRYQADNNWQSKTTPDARALIKLGLGPDHKHLLNPESAMTSQPQGTHGASISNSPGAGDSDKQQR